ncbi:MAG: hypothetical protein HQL56_02390 [Magnetococcales bacterium]|nr:hypothetical protein [Magnetococcales bacterium]
MAATPSQSSAHREPREDYFMRTPRGQPILEQCPGNKKAALKGRLSIGAEQRGTT